MEGKREKAAGSTQLRSRGRSLAGLHIVARITFLLFALLVVTASVAVAQGPTGSQGGGTVPNGTCWQCHRQPNTAGPNGVAAANALCQDCHAKAETVRKVNGTEISLRVTDADFVKTRHAVIACTDCHSTVARSPHKETQAAACESCHSNLAKHMSAGDAHLKVDCAACHFKIDTVTLDAQSDRVVIARINSAGQPLARTNHTLVSPVPCERCHTNGNTVGAAGLTLPPKDVTCIGCHVSAPVVGSPVSLLALIVFVVGLAFSASIWLGGSIAGKMGLSAMEKLSIVAERIVAVVFSRRLFTVLATALLDGILHRRILKESVARWVAHSLILLPFFARFVLGVVTGLAAQFYPDAPLTRVLVDRDAPAVAFTYDFLAILIILGAGYAGYLRRTDQGRRELTAGQDVLALVLLALIFVVGFVLEGAHIVLARLPWDQAWYAFGGAAVAALMSLAPLDWTVIYPFLFMGHALLVAVFVAYLPFSKFFHIIVSLFVVAIRPALGQPEHAARVAHEHAHSL